MLSLLQMTHQGVSRYLHFSSENIWFGFSQGYADDKILTSFIRLTFLSKHFQSNQTK